MSSNPFHVLVVEDDPKDVERLQRAFDSLGMQDAMRGVTRLEAAIDYLSGRGPYENRTLYPMPGLILISLAISRKAEFTFLKWLRQQTRLKLIPVVMLAAAREPVGFEQASELGAVTYLVKPIEPEALQSMVKAVLTYWTLNQV